MQENFKLTIRSKMPFFVPEQIAITIIKGIDVTNPDITVTSIVAPSIVPQVITIRFNREIPDGDIELDEFEVQQASIGAPAALAFASAVVLALGLVAAWEVRLDHQGLPIEHDLEVSHSSLQFQLKQDHQ